MEAIYDRLGAPSATALHAAAVRAGLDVNRKQAREFVNRKAEVQTFKPPPTSKGETATREKNSDMQADIIDLKTQRSGVFTAILAVVNPWSRRLALQPLQKKTPEAVTAAFRQILTRMDKPTTISTDMGNEFKTAFNSFLESENIVHRYKDPKQLNSLAVLDAAISKVKKQLFQRMTRQNSTQWHTLVSKAQDAYNESVINSIGGAPNDFEGDSEQAKTLQFQREQDAARALEHNDAMLKKKAEQLTSTAAFREMAPREQWQRAYKPKWESAIQGVKEIKAGQVESTDGKISALASVQPVPADTERRDAPDFRGRGLRDERLRTTLRRYALDLHDALGGRDIALTAAARLMPADYATTKPTSLLFAAFLALYPQLFVVSGEGTSKTVRAPRRRVRGKTAR